MFADNKDRFVSIGHLASENEAQQDNNKFLSEHFVLFPKRSLLFSAS